MIDTIVSTAVKKLSEFLIQEDTFALGVNYQVTYIRDELTWMQYFLKDAKQKHDTDVRIRFLVSEIRDIAFVAEDIIDTFYIEIKGIEPSKRKPLSTLINHWLCISRENAYDLSKEMKALRERLLDVSCKRGVYGIKNIGNTQERGTAALSARVPDLRRSGTRVLRHADEEHVGGFDEEIKLLEAQLFSSGPKRRVVSILGEGGLGKTTLAMKLYKNTNSMFDLQAWVSVSREWNIRVLFERLIKSLKRPTYAELKKLKKMKDYDIKNHLYEIMKDQRYLLVIDDMWNKEAWECLKSVLPDNYNGSRIVITTRTDVVAGLSEKRTFVHKLRYLRSEESWKLFKKKAFPELNGKCPKDMKKIGQEMVAKCDGLPLAIILLGGLLSSKQFDEWRVIRESIRRALKKDSTNISMLLDLSYKDLPNELKSCFLYMAIFPEDYMIDLTKLVQLWVAEDLIPQTKKGRDLEKLAHKYLQELSAKGLIQQVNDDYLSTFSVHDLIRDVAINKAKELDFFHIYAGTNSSTATRAFLTRRLAFRSRFESYMPLDHSHQQVRTLSFLQYHSLFNHASVARLLKLIHTRFHLLRVLDLEGVRVVTKKSKLNIFEAMEKMIHLRYLGLKNTDIDELPESLGNLHALQTLDVSDNRNYIMLPRDTYKLKQLRHLKGNFITSKPTKKGELLVQPTSLEGLTNLQTLDNINIDAWIKRTPADNLVLNAFSKLPNLKVLSVEFDASHRVSIHPLFRCRHLTELTIDGILWRPPKELHKFLPKLKHLTLHSKFLKDPLPTLEKLPNLLSLRLYGLINMVVTKTGFPELETLIVDGSYILNLQVEEGAMPRLRAIHVNSYTGCTIPEQLRPLLIKVPF